LYSKRREETAKFVIQDKLKKDFWSRFYGLLVYKQKKDKISDDEVKNLQQSLLEQGLYSKTESSSNKRYLRIISSNRGPGKNQKLIPFLMLLLTIITTTITGTQLLNQDPFVSWDTFFSGIYYSFALLLILFCHEMGHYLYARYYKIKVTLPYFIPFYFPLMLSFGTFGAFIRLKEPIPNKKALFDIGIAGPFAGFVVSIVFLVIGFNNLPNEAGMWEYLEKIHPLTENISGTLTFGTNMMFDLMAVTFNKTYLPMTEIYHFPYIVAGWFGLLITALNLMPIGQLDGGHITYSMYGGKSARIAILGFLALIILNIILISQYNSYVYILWPILILVFIKFKHPPTLDDSTPIGPVRKFLGYIAYVIFVLCFSPMPIYIQ